MSIDISSSPQNKWKRQRKWSPGAKKRPTQAREPRERAFFAVQLIILLARQCVPPFQLRGHSCETLVPANLLRLFDSDLYHWAFKKKLKLNA